MSKPEIFRRCSSCGASFRTSALFCPQCGNATTIGTEQASAADDERMAPAKNDHETTSGRGVNLDTVPDISADTSAVGAVPFNPSRAYGARVQQARTAARDALEDKVRPRIDKIRKASSVVLDEAAYDPGIRFLLIVGVLFVLFLVLLFLSKWLG